MKRLACGMNRGELRVWLRDFLRSSSYGCIILLVVNLAAVYTGVSLGFGWMSLIASAALGVPGVIGTLILNAIFIM